MSLIALICLIAAVALLIGLSVIDLRVKLLPDILVLPFFLAGLGFHLATHFYYVTPLEIAGGIAIGGGLLYAVRFIANHYYKQDTLGLGDVKLLAAAGAWLGHQDVLLAVIIGALAGIIHGLGVTLVQKRDGTSMRLSALSIPAGPGFAVGIVFAAALKFASFFDLFFQGGILTP